VSDILSLKYQNDLLTQEVKRRVDQLAAINTVAATVSQSLDLDVTLDTALSAVLEIVGAEAGGISLIDQETREVVIRAQQGWTRDLNERPMRIPVDKGMSGRVIQNDDVIIDNDLDNSEDLAIPSFLEEQFRSIVMAPMHARGEIIGILSIMSSQPNHFEREITAVLRAIADTVGVALGNAQLYESTVENENNLVAILDSSSDGIIATDQKGRIRLINDEAAKMFKVNAHELRGTPLHDIPIAPRVRELLLRALENKGRDKRQSFEVTLDSEIIVSVAVSPVYVEQQLEQKATTNGWIMVLHDVTHLRKAEKARAQFIAAAAHDMRSPLGVTINAVKLLETMIDLSDPTVAELIELAENGVNRLQALIDDGHIHPGQELDPWGTPFALRVEGSDLIITSYGADKKPGGEDENRDRISDGVAFR